MSKKWFKDALAAFKSVRLMRKAGVEGALTVIEADSLTAPVCMTPEEHEAMLFHQRGTLASYQLAYDCIEAMAEGKSRCKYCMEYEHCHNKRKGNVRGCEDWILAFPDIMIAGVDEDEPAATEEAGAAEQKPSEEQLACPEQGSET